MKRLGAWLKTNRKTLLSFLAALIGVGALLLYKLGSLTGQMAAREQFLPSFHSTLRALWNNPINLPLELSRLLVAGLSPYGGYTSSRLPSAVLGFLTVGLFYWLVRRWYGWRIAFFGSVMLAISPWFLHTARLATPDIVYPFAMTCLLTLYALYHHQPTRQRYFLILSIGLSLLIYVPGMLFFILALYILEWKKLRASQKQSNKRQRLIVTLVPLLIIIPWVHTVYKTTSFSKAILGLPATWPSPLEYLENIGRVPLYIFGRGPLDPVTNLGRLALINSFTIVMFTVGLYLYGKYWRSNRTRLLLVLSLLSLGLIALRGPVTIGLLLPVVVVVASGGMGYLLHLWLRVFPRNPLARGLGIGLLALTLAFSATYNTRQYFVAWPHNAATQAAFQQRR